MDMRRRERALTTPDEITAVLEHCQIARLGLVGEKGPYVVPVNFAYAVRDDNITIYAHGAPSGRKLAMINADPRCCVEVDHMIGLATGETGQPCGHSTYYESVIGTGFARIVTDPNEVRHALQLLVARHMPDDVDAVPALPKNVVVVAVDLDTVTGKANRPS
ncbi:MAG: pyridoxamine 5'-phosphate oxidase family protein [Propionibacteriaceae bacterium]|nr:pyridoxamine 5'-phosphate oxidase family protein [Propionibacteriaceae bacterium]